MNTEQEHITRRCKIAKCHIHYGAVGCDKCKTTISDDSLTTMERPNGVRDRANDAGWRYVHYRVASHLCQRTEPDVVKQGYMILCGECLKEYIIDMGDRQLINKWATNIVGIPKKAKAVTA